MPQPSKKPHNRVFAETARRAALLADPPKPTAAYINKAVDDEFALLKAAKDGNRNTQLNKTSFAIGQMVGGGWIEEAGYKEDLERAGFDLGLDADEIHKTVKSGLDAGKL